MLLLLTFVIPLTQKDAPLQDVRPRLLWLDNWIVGFQGGEAIMFHTAIFIHNPVQMKKQRDIAGLLPWSQHPNKYINNDIYICIYYGIYYLYIY